MPDYLNEDERKAVSEALDNTPSIYNRLMAGYKAEKESNKEEARTWVASLSIAEKREVLEKLTIARDALIDSLRTHEVTHIQRVERQQIEQQRPGIKEP